MQAAPESGIDVRITDRAASRVRQLLDRESRVGLALRVYVQGGGCSGFQYGFSLDEAVAEDDARVEQDGVIMVIDPLSYQYLTGSEIDFRDDLVGARFVVNNPNATTTCGCGASFAV